MHRDVMQIEDVIENADNSRPLIIVDGQVVDLADFLQWHPGGTAVLLANLGRNASADFHHVPAHAHPGVRSKLRQFVVAEVDEVSLPDAWDSLGELLDYVRLVRNSFAVQLSSERDPVHELVYLGQSCRHLLDDHVRAFLSGFSALLGRTADPALLRRLDELAAGVEASVEDSLAKADPLLAASRAQRLREHCVTLLDDLLAAASAAVRAIRTPGAETENPAARVEEVVSVIEKWIDRSECAQLDEV